MNSKGSEKRIYSKSDCPPTPQILQDHARRLDPPLYHFLRVVYITIGFMEHRA